MRPVRDALHIEGEVKLIDAVYPTESKENVIEVRRCSKLICFQIYACCIVSGFCDKKIILTIEGTQQRISSKGIEEVDPEFL